MSTPVFDARQVRRAFSRSAASYEAAARLQHAVDARLLESLDYLDDPALARAPPRRVLDLALPMLREGRAAARPGGWLANPFARRPLPVCADARALPLAEGSVDVIFSNLCLQWVEDLPAVFAGFRRVLRPGGLMLCSSFGPETLAELREAFAQADASPHVSPFASIAQFGDALLSAGFRDPVVDRDLFNLTYPDLPALMRELRAIGATNAMASRRRSLTGRARFAAAAAAYEPLRDGQGRLPSSWEVIYAQAWAPAPGMPIREGGHEVAAVPLSQIPIRRRPQP